MYHKALLSPLLFVLYRDSNQLQTCLRTDIIEMYHMVKNLGFIMDSDTSLKKIYVNSTIKKGYNTLRCLYRSKRFLNDALKSYCVTP